MSNEAGKLNSHNQVNRRATQRVMISSNIKLCKEKMTNSNQANGRLILKIKKFIPLTCGNLLFSYC